MIGTLIPDVFSQRGVAIRKTCTTRLLTPTQTADWGRIKLTACLLPVLVRPLFVVDKRWRILRLRADKGNIKELKWSNKKRTSYALHTYERCRRKQLLAVSDLLSFAQNAAIFTEFGTQYSCLTTWAFCESCLSHILKMLAHKVANDWSKVP